MTAKKKTKKSRKMKKSSSYIPGEQMEKTLAQTTGAIVGVSLGLATVGIVGGLLK